MPRDFVGSGRRASGGVEKRGEIAIRDRRGGHRERRGAARARGRGIAACMHARLPFERGRGPGKAGQPILNF